MSIQKTISAGERSMLQKSTSFGENDLPVDVYLTLILSRHARDLLSSGRLHDMAFFAAHLEFHLVLWLTKEKYCLLVYCLSLKCANFVDYRNRAARVQDFPLALQKLHKDFQWPFPLLSYTLMEQLNKKMQLSPVRG